VDAGLFSKIGAAGEACGIPSARMPTLRVASGGLVAMSRGFKAVTLFRMACPCATEEILSDERAAAWLTEIAAGREPSR
jgi:hypothetical protein